MLSSGNGSLLVRWESSAVWLPRRLFGVFAVWFDDETLQKQEVYLPSLPPEYEPHRLAQVMQRQQVSLSQFISSDCDWSVGFYCCFTLRIPTVIVCRNCGWNMWTRSACCTTRKRFCPCGKKCRASQLSRRPKLQASPTPPALTMVLCWNFGLGLKMLREPRQAQFWLQ